MAELPTEEMLKQLYIDWFKDQFGLPPIVTSSTGLPAVHFALYVLERYGQQAEEAGES
ncbi:MAG: hypothetical protein LW834_17520 [Cyanobium sp. 49614_E6]|jgi:hypothetical protein|nr:hypothetical protein [Cyanobium sp. 49614_E6]MCE2838724.1 hypothetical protein [Cyanobium sp. 49614_E6]